MIHDKPQDAIEFQYFTLGTMFGITVFALALVLWNLMQ